MTTGQTTLRHAQPLRYAECQNYRLRRQWAIVSGDLQFPHEWPSIRLNDSWSLYHHPDTRIMAPTVKPGIAIIGIAVNSETCYQDMPAELTRIVEATEQDRTNFLRTLCGTYVAIWFSPEGVSLYTDPAGMMQVYYTNRRVSSTVALLGRLERNRDVDAQYPFGHDNDWYPGNVTPFHGVKALLANHKLELDTGNTSRFWPSAEPASLGETEGVISISNKLRTLAHNLLDYDPVLCSITGGKDSRVSLAALGEASSQVEFFTVKSAKVKPCDLAIPRVISETFSLDHRFILQAETPSWLIDLYDEMTHGMSIGNRRNIAGSVASVAAPNYIHLNGNLGALAKSYFWPSRSPKCVDVESLCKEFVAKPPFIHSAVEYWLKSVPELPPALVYNLMYLEQRGGRWMGPGENASGLFFDSFSLFQSREVFEMICGLPLRTQYGGGLLIRLVEQLWPELATVPYCRSRRNWSGRLPRGFKNRLKRLTGQQM